MQLENRKVLLIGASGGIGQSIARVMDTHGAQLMMVGRNEAKLAQLSQRLKGKHGSIIADINTLAGRSAVMAECQQSGVDILINAAGTLDFQFYDQQDPASVEQIISTNLLSPMLLCQQLIPLLKQRQQAVILNIGSIFGSIGHPGFAAYCASKFGLRGFTEALQRELADTAVRVLYLAPRATRTDLNSSVVSELNTALGNATDSPDRVAHELLGLLSGNKMQCYMGWPEKLFVRLNALLPRLVDNALVKKLPLIHQFAQDDLRSDET
tara:strand:+ start:5071 stop:5874 length:804 start_codon:yes stop_codon:yes gene_type:complete